MTCRCFLQRKDDLMKLSSDFLTHAANGEHFTVPTGGAKFSGIVKSNETAAFIVECLKSDTTESAVTDKLLERYSGASRETVMEDVKDIIAKLRSIGAVED